MALSAERNRQMAVLKELLRADPSDYTKPELTEEE